jgi:hypothetical protein
MSHEYGLGTAKESPLVPDPEKSFFLLAFLLEIILKP